MKLEEYDYKVEAMTDYLPAYKGLGEIYLNIPSAGYRIFNENSKLKN